jgi:hypothetical protein
MQQRRRIRFEAIESEYAEMATQPVARSVPHDKRQRQGDRRCRQLGAKPKRTSRRHRECGAFDPSATSAVQSCCCATYRLNPRAIASLRCGRLSSSVLGPHEAARVVAPLATTFTTVATDEACRDLSNRTTN